MSLVVQNNRDFSSTLIKGLNSLKNTGGIDFDYYSVKPLYIGGLESALTDEIVHIIRSFKNVFSRKMDVLLITDVCEDRADYYFYLKNERFSEDTFKMVDGVKPIYGQMLELEENWKKLKLDISTFNVSNSNDSCLLISLDLKARSL